MRRISERLNAILGRIADKKKLGFSVGVAFFCVGALCIYVSASLTLSGWKRVLILALLPGVFIILGIIFAFWRGVIARDPNRRFIPKLDALRSLNHLGMLIPRKHREAFLGDISEDVADYRKQGVSEFRVTLHVYWQVGIIVALRSVGLVKWLAGGWAISLAKQAFEKYVN